MRPLVLLLLLLLSCAFPTSPSGALTLTFEELSIAQEAGEPIPDGYGGLSWSPEFVGLNVPLYASHLPVEVKGYENGLVSGEQLAFNALALPASIWGTPFDLESAYLTAAWRDELGIEIEGFVDGVVVYSMTVVVNPDAPSFVEFGFEGVDRVTFTSLGRTDVFGLGAHFALDDLTLTFVPEPSTGALMGFGMIALAGRRVRRTRLRRTLLALREPSCVSATTGPGALRRPPAPRVDGARQYL